MRRLGWIVLSLLVVTGLPGPTASEAQDGKIVAVNWSTTDIKDGIYNLVNDAFFQWTYDLKQAIKDLR